MPAEAAAEQEHQQEEAIEKLGAKLAKAASSADVGALKDIVQDFYRDAVDLRTKNRELTRDLAAARGKVKDGDVVLSGDEAKAYTALLKLDIPLKDLPAQLKAGGDALKENTGLRSAQYAAEAAEILGWNPKVLAGLVRLNHLTLDFAQETDDAAEPGEDGKRPKKRVPVVVLEDEDEDPLPLDDYVEQHLGDFRDALAGAEAARKSDREAPTPHGPRIVRQRSGEGGNRGGGVSEQQLDTQKRRQVNYSA